ncbi:MAG: hypothetical protein JOZ38_02170, partial [Candidatus Eremiobacteraeota bacterium]|nr:hypothetical protein [Candidatus Eremiobacteraeota bacterium]
VAGTTLAFGSQAAVDIKTIFAADQAISKLLDDLDAFCKTRRQASATVPTTDTDFAFCTW